MTIMNNNNQDMADMVPSWGPYVISIFAKNEAELIYVEQLVPSDGDREHIYWSCCDFYFEKQGGYAGIQHQKDNIIDGVPFIRNNICSIWDTTELDTDLPPEATLTYALPGLHHSHFGNEGTGLHTSHPMPWKLDQWYAMVVRRWYVPGERVTHMAMFMYCYGDNKWTHYMSASIPRKDIPFTGTECTGFLERYAGDALKYYGIYGQHFRMDKHGVWEKPIRYEASAGGNPNYWSAELYQDVNIKLSAGGLHNNNREHMILDPNQYDEKPKPVIDPIVTSVTPYYQDHSVSVDWSISDNAPPQLKYHVRLIKDTIYIETGQLITEQIAYSPETRSITLNSGALPAGDYFVTVEFYDIFNQKSNYGYQGFTVY